MNPEALLLRRCYPVPVTFADLRAAYDNASCYKWVRDGARLTFTASLKQVTGAIDEVYAVIDGREVRVATVQDSANYKTTFIWLKPLHDLLAIADEAGYWERPHEVRLDLSPRPVMHDEVARAVLTGQKYVEKQLTKVSYDNEMFDATRR